jgi:hypothetical protein
VTPAERFNNARDLLRNDVFKEACEVLERNLMDSWKATPPDAWKQRESLYERLQALRDIRVQLENFIHTAAMETTAY